MSRPHPAPRSVSNGFDEVCAQLENALLEKAMVFLEHAELGAGIEARAQRRFDSPPENQIAASKGVSAIQQSQS